MTKRICEFPGCDRPHEAKGLCGSHYAQSRYGVDGVLRPLGASPEGEAAVERAAMLTITIGQHLDSAAAATVQRDDALLAASRGGVGYAEIQRRTGLTESVVERGIHRALQRHPEARRRRQDA